MDCKSVLGLRAIVCMLSRGYFFEGGRKVGSGVRKIQLFLLGFSCTTLWLHCEPHATAVFKKSLRRVMYRRKEN